MNLNEDYYRLLQVHPAATQQEIRKAYRKLAHQYHPDKAAVSTASEAFALLQKAYATLSHTESRKNYDLVYFSKRINQAAAATITDPRQLLQLTINLSNRIQSQDASMINSGAVHAELMLIFGEQHLLLLDKTTPDFRKELMNELMRCLRVLPYQQATSILAEIIQHTPVKLEMLSSMQQELRMLFIWQYAKLPLAVLAGLLLCLCIYYAG
jgi:hypothetical protein